MEGNYAASNANLKGAQASVERGNLDPLVILKDAHENAKQVRLGSSTACIVVVDGNQLK